jgi:transposase InsO family protein
LAAEQRSCPSVAAAASSSLHLQLVDMGGARVLCDVRLPHPRPLVPLSYRRKIFSAVHGLAHPGIRASRRMLTSRFVWVGLSKDVAAWCKDCQQCARGKVHKQPAAPVHAIPVPQHRFTHVHVDLVGPLPTSAEGYRYLFTMVDRTSRWLEAVPLKVMDAAACAATFIASWVARFGVPARLTSDQGRQFVSSLWTHTCQQLGVEHITTTAYHPQSNGMVERAHRQLKDALRARLAGPAWPDHLPWVLLGLRSAPKENSGVSSAERLYGAPLALPAQFVAAKEPPMRQLLQKLDSATPDRTVPPLPGPSPIPPHLATAELVYVRRGDAAPPLSPQYVGPYLVLQRGDKVFKLRIGDGVQAISVDRLKPHLGATDVAPAVPPLRGRPAMVRDGVSFAAAVTGGGHCGGSAAGQ